MKKNSQGYIQMVFENRHGRSVASEVYHRGNSRVSSLVGFYQEKTPYYFFINSGGGFLEGENYEIDVELKDDTSAILTSQSPTYIFKCDDSIFTTCKNRITIGKNSMLEYINDEIIPYENSCYKQDTEIHLTSTSTLILEDGVTAGWSSNESLFSYSSLHLKTTIFRDNKLFYNDYLLSEPTKNEISSLGYFEGYTNFNSLIIISPYCTKEVTEKIKENIKTMEEKKSFDAYFGLSELDENGFVVRALAKKGEDNKKILSHIINLFRENAMNLPELDLRKNR